MRVGDRASFVALAALATTVLVLARWLVPDAQGHGTHVQLGLPPCAFLLVTGVPCPTCGLTTAFAHMARFEIARAFAAHALGPVLFSTTALLPPACVWACVRGWRLDSMLHGIAPRLLLVLTSAGLLQWIARLALAA